MVGPASLIIRDLKELFRAWNHPQRQKSAGVWIPAGYLLPQVGRVGLWGNTWCKPLAVAAARPHRAGTYIPRPAPPRGPGLTARFAVDLAFPLVANMRHSERRQAARPTCVRSASAWPTRSPRHLRRHGRVRRPVVQGRRHREHVLLVRDGHARDRLRRLADHAEPEGARLSRRRRYGRGSAGQEAGVGARMRRQ